MKKIPTYKIKLSEYQVKTCPNFANIGKKIDKIIKNNYLGQKIVIRCLSSSDHKGKTADSIIKIIKKLGTDRYNPKIKGDRYDNLGKKNIDLFGLDFKISNKKDIMTYLLKPFYDYPLSSGKKPIKIDLILLYDRQQLKMVIHTYDNIRKKRDGFIFKDPNNKLKALKGIIKII